jgi:DNA primase
MEHLGMSFPEAVKDLAQQYGLQVPEEDLSPIERARQAQARAQQSSLTDLLEKAAQAYTAELKEAGHAIDYLKGRGLSGEVARDFGLGYAPAGWRFLAGIFPDYSQERLVECGLVITGQDSEAPEARRYDRFRDRIMFPIRNVKGQCIGFGGRVLGDEKPKYLNSPETPVFSKGRELYGLFEARAALREHGYALVTEGYMDVVALAQLGFANAVATLGTACTSDHVQKLFRFTDAVVFSFDGDAAGRRAARKALDAALPFASDTRSIKFLFLPDEHDPDSFIRQFGREAFARHVEQAVPLSRFLMEAASQDCEMASAEGRARMASQARGLWTALPDGALKRQLLAEIADTVQIDSRELLQVWQPGRSQGPPREGRRQGAAPTPSLSAGSVQAARASRPPHRLPGRIQPASREDRVLRMLLTEPGLWDRIGDAEHAVLCALPAPHGSLFAWLEAQIHEHGVQPWAALREGLRGHPQEAYALQQLAQIPAGIEPTWDETQPVLGELLKRARQLEMDDLAQRAATDPQAMARYRELAAQGR